MHDDPNTRDGQNEDERDEAASTTREPDAPYEPHEDDDSPLGDTDQHSDA